MTFHLDPNDNDEQVKYYIKYFGRLVVFIIQAPLTIYILANPNADYPNSVLKEPESRLINTYN